MKIFIELPTWLGDAVMASSAIENIIKHFPNSKITLFGSFVSINTLKNHKNVEKIILDESKNTKFRLLWLYKNIKKLNKFDIAISFRSSLNSKFLLKFIKAKKNIQFKSNFKNMHQVQKYNLFISKNLNIDRKSVV